MGSKCFCKPILVADDVAFNIISIEGLMNSFGLKIDKAYDGQTALDKLDKEIAKGCYDTHNFNKLIILDNSMPNKSGIQVAYEIRKLQQAHMYPDNLIVILLTGENENDIERMILNSYSNNDLFDMIL